MNNAVMDCILIWYKMQLHHTVAKNIVTCSATWHTMPIDWLIFKAFLPCCSGHKMHSMQTT